MHSSATRRKRKARAWISNTQRSPTNPPISGRRTTVFTSSARAAAHDARRDTAGDTQE